MTKTQTAIATIAVAIYLRLSKDDHNFKSESMSISNQRDLLLSYCKEMGWSVYDIYIDDGYTGTNFDRPRFKDMIADIEAGYINVVITKDLSRLGRNYIEAGRYTDIFFPEHGVRYVALNDSYDSDNGEDDLVPMRHVMNGWYPKDISRKTRSAKHTSAKQGKFMGSKAPYGYMKSPENKHQLIIDPPAAEIVKRLFREFAAGETGRGMAAQLNDEGVDTPAMYFYKQSGKKCTKENSCGEWGSNSIMQLLKNQVYIGDMVQCKRTTLSYTSKKRLVTNPNGWVVVEGTHEPLVDKLTWERVQRRINANKRATNNSGIKSNSTKEISLFAGILRCGDCGSSMAYNRKARKDGTYRQFYRCGAYSNNASKCTTHTVELELIEGVVLAEIQHHASMAVQDEQGLTNRLLAFCGEESKNKKAAQEKSLRDCINRIAFVREASKKLFEEKMAGNVPEGLFKSMLAEYENELAELEEKAVDLRLVVNNAKADEAQIQNWLALIKECVTITKLDRHLLSQLVEQIDVHENEDEYGLKAISIRVKYNFVGYLL